MNGEQATYYTRDNKGNLIGERTPDGNRWYYLKDALGSVVAVVSGSGAVANRYGYDPYGRMVSQVGSVGNPWGFGSGYLDPTGLVKFGTRYYDPNLGRWTQRDPIGGSIRAPSTLNRCVSRGGATWCRHVDWRWCTNLQRLPGGAREVNARTARATLT
jgi:RHS repeat-associated protein